MSLVINIHHVSGSLAGQSQRLSLDNQAHVRLGRNADSDIKFNDAVEDNVSGTHAELSFENGRLYIEDKRSSNGTFVNGAPCPPFQKISVPDGSRIRLAQDGPEMQITWDAAHVAPPSPAAPAPAQSSLPPKQSVGRETLLREIDRTKQEERSAMTAEVARSRRSTGLVVGAVTLGLLILAGAGGFLLYQTTQQEIEAAKDKLTAVSEVANRDVWQDVERAASPAVAFVNCRYRLERPVVAEGGTAVTVRLSGGQVTGSAVLIRPGVLLTAKHVVEPWLYSVDWGKTDFKSWDGFARATGATPVYELLEIQFPGFQPITATVSATSETSDLAVLTIPQVNVEPVPVVTTNQAINVTDEVAIIGYPRGLGRVSLVTRDRSSANTTLTEVANMEPTFFKGTVTRPVPEIGETSHLFSIDASIEPGNSGGPVINDNGEVVGIVVARLEVGKQAETINNIQVFYREVVESAGQAASPGDMEKFLSRAGIL